MPTVLPSVDLMQVNGRNVAGSVRNRAIVAWFESEGGQEWAAERRQLLHHDEPDAVISTMSSRDIAGAGGDANGSRDTGAAGSPRSVASAPPSAPSTCAAPPSTCAAPPSAPSTGDAGVGGRGRGKGDAAAGGRGRGSGAAGEDDVSGGVAARSAGSPAASSAAIGGTKRRRR